MIMRLMFLFLKSCQFGDMSFSCAIDCIGFDMVLIENQSGVFFWLHGAPLKMGQSGK